jgi:hypothetical protein
MKANSTEITRSVIAVREITKIVSSCSPLNSSTALEAELLESTPYRKK